MPENICFQTVVLEKTLKSLAVDSKDMLMLKLQYFGHLMGRADSLEETMILGKLRAGSEGGDRE